MPGPATAPSQEEDALSANAGAPESISARAREDSGGRKGIGGSPAGLQEVLDLLATVVQMPGFQAAANAFVTELAVSRGFTRASLGLARRGRIALAAVSHASAPDRRGSLAVRLEASMQEAIDRAAVVVSEGSEAAASLPLVDGGRVRGALLLERAGGRPISAGTIAFCEAALGLAGPFLLLRRAAERPLRAAAAETAGRWLRRLLGPGHLAWKLAALILPAALLVLFGATGEDRISARTILEGSVQRAAVAPFDGYIAEAPARAGDAVVEGALLCRLEDRELQLELLKWKSQEEQQAKAHRRALAERNAAEARIVSAQLRQTRAQLQLVEEQIARTRIVSPIAGRVVRGDLSQSIGAPVRRGDVLFEVAPLDSFRVVLEVDERDIGRIEPGQEGRIALVALPGKRIPIRVERLTPVAFVSDGRNCFRVEAQLVTPDDGLLRPGMEGAGKIIAGRRSLAWIWTHDVIAGIRLKLWTWMP